MKTRYEKTISLKEIAVTNNISISAAEYRLEYNIKTIEDCQNASEEYLCGFLKDKNSVNISNQLSNNKTLVDIIKKDLTHAYYGFKTDKGRSYLVKTNIRLTGEA